MQSLILYAILKAIRDAQLVKADNPWTKEEKQQPLYSLENKWRSFGVLELFGKRIQENIDKIHAMPASDLQFCITFSIVVILVAVASTSILRYFYRMNVDPFDSQPIFIDYGLKACVFLTSASVFLCFFDLFIDFNKDLIRYSFFLNFILSIFPYQKKQKTNVRLPHQVRGSFLYTLLGERFSGFYYYIVIFFVIKFIEAVFINYIFAFNLILKPFGIIFLPHLDPNEVFLFYSFYFLNTSIVLLVINSYRKYRLNKSI